MKFYTVESLGPKRKLTPEGFLLVEDVPIGRTGVMIYGPNEVPVTPGRDGVVRIERTADEVFRDVTIASFAGKPVTDDHPSEPVTPENWSKVARGTVLNPRRGTNGHSDCIVADLLITDKNTIILVNDGKREVSCGYDAEYEEIAPGAGRQVDIIGNHVALVDKGRCGDRCSIADRKMVRDNASSITPHQERTMSGKKTLWQRIKDAMAANDNATVQTLLAQGEAKAPQILTTRDEEEERAEGEHTHIHIHGAGDEGGETKDEPDPNAPPQWAQDFMASVDARFSDFETRFGGKGAGEGEGESMDDATVGAMQGELPDEVTADQIRATTDSVRLAEPFAAVIAAAEILVPGIQVPTFDKAAKPKVSVDAICALRRTALQSAVATKDGASFITTALGGKPLNLPKMSCDAVRTLFNSTVAWRKAANHAQQFDTSTQQQQRRTNDADQAKKRPRTLVELNEANKKFWDNQKQRA